MNTPINEPKTDLALLRLLVALDRRTKTAIANHLGINPGNFRNYLLGRATLSADLTGKAISGLGVTRTASGVSLDRGRVFDWQIGSDPGNLATMLELVGIDAIDPLEISIVMSMEAAQQPPEDGQFATLYLLRSNEYRVRLLRTLDREVLEHVKPLDPETLPLVKPTDPLEIRLSVRDYNDWMDAVPISPVAMDKVTGNEMGYNWDEVVAYLKSRKIPPQAVYEKYLAEESAEIVGRVISARRDAKSGDKS